MSGMTLNAEVASARQSRLVAEALVDGHNRTQVERRARALGISRDMADVVATVCCRRPDVDHEPTRRSTVTEGASRS